MGDLTKAQRAHLEAVEADAWLWSSQNALCDAVATAHNNGEVLPVDVRAALAVFRLREIGRKEAVLHEYEVLKETSDD